MKYSLKVQAAWLESLINSLEGEDKAIAQAVQDRLNGGKTKFKLYQHFFSTWYDWYIQQTKGIKPKATPAYGKALNEIIAYLVDISPEKTEEQALNAWTVILGNWNRLTPFLQGMKKLPDINKYIDEIADKVKNGRSHQGIRDVPGSNTAGVRGTESYESRAADVLNRLKTKSGR